MAAFTLLGNLMVLGGRVFSRDDNKILSLFIRNLAGEWWWRRQLWSLAVLGNSNHDGNDGMVMVIVTVLEGRDEKRERKIKLFIPISLDR